MVDSALTLPLVALRYRMQSESSRIPTLKVRNDRC